MAVWIDEDGVLVRPAESATIEQSSLRGVDIPADADDRISRTLREVQKIPDRAEQYRAAIVDWVEHGAASRFALDPDEVVARSKPRSLDHARAAACFELGHHLLATEGHDAAVPWWREAHRLHPENWTYKRQAWTLVTTEGDAEPDLMQPPNDVYEGSWLEDVVAGGGGEAYVTEPDL